LGVSPSLSESLLSDKRTSQPLPVFNDLLITDASKVATCVREWLLEKSNDGKTGGVDKPVFGESGVGDADRSIGGKALRPCPISD
jgi:hypothetical protein